MLSSSACSHNLDQLGKCITCDEALTETTFHRLKENKNNQEHKLPGWWQRLLSGRVSILLCFSSHCLLVQLSLAGGLSCSSGRTCAASVGGKARSVLVTQTRGWGRLRRDVAGVCSAWQLSVGGEQVSGGGEGSQAAGDVGQQWQIREALDVGLELLSHLSHSRQFLFVLLQQKKSGDQRLLAAPQKVFFHEK